MVLILDRETNVPPRATGLQCGAGYSNLRVWKEHRNAYILKYCPARYAETGSRHLATARNR
jgi:hypothetical protein